MITSGDRSPGFAAWQRKFGDGLFQGIRTESSLQVQYLCAVIVLIVGAFLSLETWRWGVLLTCIAMVLSAEYFNSAIEQLVRSLKPGHSSEIAKALHLAAAAVLIASLLATVIAIITLAMPIQEWLNPVASRQ
jgi:diacylglycerol kinase (ATP)